jgi:hypothetical protein
LWQSNGVSKVDDKKPNNNNNNTGEGRGTNHDDELEHTINFL